jgi:hypothetical protein
MVWFKQNPEVVSTELEEGAVLLNMETRTYYSLNDVGVEIWRLIEATQGIEELTGELLRKFEAGKDKAESLVSGFIQQLESEKLLKQEQNPVEAKAQPLEKMPEREEKKKPFVEPQLIKHDEPLHDIPLTPFDPQLPLAE